MDKYQELSDEQLIEQLRLGDSKVMDYILNKYKPLVLGRANAMYLIGGDTDDLIQEGMIGLFKAIRDYCEDKEASFFYFAELCINRQLYSAVEASRRKKHMPLNTYISFYSKDDEDGKSLAETLPALTDNPEQLVIARESIRQFWEHVRAQLSPMERKVLDYYLAGLNYRQIAERMGKTPKAIDNALSRIKAKIR